MSRHPGKGNMISPTSAVAWMSMIHPKVPEWRKVVCHHRHSQGGSVVRSEDSLLNGVNFAGAPAATLCPPCAGAAASGIFARAENRNRLRRRYLRGFEALDCFAIQLLTQRPLQSPERRTLFRSDETECLARLAHAGGSAAAMDVIL